MQTRKKIEIVPIPMDAETRARLVRLARVAGEEPVECAAALLRDLLIDDERENGDSSRILHS